MTRNAWKPVDKMYISSFNMFNFTFPSINIWISFFIQIGNIYAQNHIVAVLNCKCTFPYLQ